MNPIITWGYEPAFAVGRFTANWDVEEAEQRIAETRAAVR